MENREAREYLLKIPVWTKKKNSFEDIRAFLEEMGNPDRSFRIIHVAGTNGKGSVCAFLSSMLKEAKIRTGVFTSPHLTDIRERFLVDGELVREGLFQKSFEKVRDLTERMRERGKCHPTFFEFLFYMGLVIFEESGVRYVVLETGLGGRLDTTNVIDPPQAAVITSISIDHTEYLGDTIEKIAGEKAGIIKAGIPVIYDDSSQAASAVIKNRILQVEAKGYPVRREEICITRKDSLLPDGFEVDFASSESKEVKVLVPFAADYQAVNALLAFRTLEILRPAGMSLERMAAGIRKTKWPGRMEQALPGVYLDGAHNAGGINAFIDTVRRLSKQKGAGVSLLFAVVSDKEYREMIHAVCSQLSLIEIIVAHINNQRGMESAELLEAFCREASCPVLGFHTVSAAFEYALSQKKEEDLLFCAGSLYLIGEIKDMLKRDSSQALSGRGEL